jgi:hypothetical protein
MAEVDVAALDEVHDLYRVDPSEFVEARAALVKQLRAEKRVDEARAVVKLRKPTAPSWALDQVAHEEPALIEAALAAGDALQAATTETLDGDASNLRAATDAEGKASAAVIDAAGGHLTLTADHRERMASTLRAAITDDGVRALLVAGLLAADHEPPPMGFAAETTAPAPADAPPSPELPAVKGAAKARLAEAPADEPPARAKRKVRRVGTPGSAKRTPVDEVDARRKAKEVERLQAEEAERRRAEAARAKERKRQQAALDAAAAKTRTRADRLDALARQAEEAAADARRDADAATADATAAESAAAAGPPD